LAYYEGTHWLKANNSTPAVVFLKRGAGLVFTQRQTHLCFLQANSSNFRHGEFVQNQGMARFPLAARRPHVDFVALHSVSGPEIFHVEFFTAGTPGPEFSS
jgi:hypothetical protein